MPNRKDWRENLGVDAVHAVEQLLERTMRRRMADALSELAKCQFFDDDIELLPVNADWVDGDNHPIEKENLQSIQSLLDNPVDDGSLHLEARHYYVSLKDVLKVLERLGEVILPKENDGTSKRKD